MDLKPGVYLNVPFEAYKEWPFLNHSALKLIKNSPAHYRELYNSVERKESKSLLIGRAVDCALLEPENFYQDFVVAPDIRRGTKAYDAWAEQHAGKDKLSTSEWKDVHGTVECLKRSPKAMALLKSGHIQASVVWAEPLLNGALCKGRMDAYHPEMGIVVDLKTTESAKPASFAKSIFKYGYYTQLAFYMRGLRALGLKADRSVLVAVETSAPYVGLKIFELLPELLEKANKENEILLKTLMDCQLTNNWPGYGDDIEMIGVPAWAEHEINQRIDSEEENGERI